ncbi:MAG: hypothetical protein SangKO_073980 [Sandaracinaceae bacterium]
MGLSSLDPSGSTESIVLGHQMAVGDFDGDDEEELAIGASTYDMPGQPGAGAVFLVDSGSWGPLPAGRIDLDAPGIGAADGDAFGESLAVFPKYAGLPDELYIGAPGRGQVFRYENGSYDGPWSSTAGLPGFGRRLAAGDLLKNGVAEVVVGSDEPAVLEIMSHGTLLNTPDPRGSSEFFPLAIADLDGDGFEDLLAVSVPLGVPGYDNAVYFAPGNGTLVPEAPQEFQLGGREAWDDLGRVGVIGDFDGDWDLELVLGAPVRNSTGWGQVYAFTEGTALDWVAGEPNTVTQESALQCDVCAVHEWSDGTICDGGSGALICVDQSCVTRRCGDGYRQTAAGPWSREACDDGNNLDGDLCSATCGASSYTVATTGDDRNTPYGPRYTAGVDGTGAFLITWSAPTAVVGRLGDYEIRGQRFTRRGVPDGAELVLSSPLTLGIDPTPSVAGLASGGWVVTWSEPGGDDSMAGVVFRIVEPDGSMHGVEVAASETYLDQLAPSVAALDSGFVVTWTDTSLSLLTGPARRVVARRFFESGRPDGEDFVVSTEPEREHAESVVTASGDTFLIAWVDGAEPSATRPTSAGAASTRPAPSTRPTSCSKTRAPPRSRWPPSTRATSSPPGGTALPTPGETSTRGASRAPGHRSSRPLRSSRARWAARPSPRSTPPASPRCRAGTTR